MDTSERGRAKSEKPADVLAQALCQVKNLNREVNRLAHESRLTAAKLAASVKENEQLRAERDRREAQLENERCVADRRRRAIMVFRSRLGLDPLGGALAGIDLTDNERALFFGADPKSLAPAVRADEPATPTTSATPRATTGREPSHGNAPCPPSSVPVSLFQETAKDLARHVGGDPC